MYRPMPTVPSRFAFQLLLLLFLAAAGLAPARAEEPWAWKAGTFVQSEYRELAGTLLLSSASPPVVRAEGRDYLLILLVPEAEIPQFKNKTAIILKGIAGAVGRSGQATQYLFWPMACTIRTQTYIFPDPTDLHREWLGNLGRE